MVRGRPVTVPRAMVELRDTPPYEWTVVRPAPPRDPYIVCPGCRHRMDLPERSVTTTRCSRCNSAFAIGWEPAVRVSPVPGLRPDRRVAPRRKSTDRRKASRATKDRRATPDRRRRSTSW